MEYISSFENYLRENGKADKTIESYTGDVRGFIGFLSLKGITFEGVLNRFAVNSYKNHLLQENYESTLPGSFSEVQRKEILKRSDMNWCRDRNICTTEK